MDFFKYFHFGLKRKYKYLLFGVVVALLVFNLLSLFGYCATYDGVISNVNLSSSTNSITEGTSIIRYIKLEKGHKYKVSLTASATRYYAFTRETPAVGVDIFGLNSIQPSSSIEFVASDNYFLALNSNFDYEDLGIQNYNGVMWSLNENLSGDTMWSTFKAAIPFISVVIIVCCGFYFISRLVDKSFVGK